MPFIRSIAKSLVWRAIGVVLLGGLAWAFTGSVLESLAIALTFNGIRVVLYVFHEELWERWPPLAGVGRPPGTLLPNGIEKPYPSAESRLQVRLRRARGVSAGPRAGRPG